MVLEQRGQAEDRNVLHGCRICGAEWRGAKYATACPGSHADAVDRPAHYTASPSGVECITITEHMGFCVGNAVKYLWRAGLKGPALEDLRKARWYVDREIARLEAQK